MQNNSFEYLKEEFGLKDSTIELYKKVNEKVKERFSEIEETDIIRQKFLKLFRITVFHMLTLGRQPDMDMMIWAETLLIKFTPKF